MSILETIKEIEVKSEGLKEEAMQKAASLLEEAKITCEEEIKALYLQAGKSQEAKATELSKMIAQKERVILENYQDLDEKIRKDTESRIEKTVNYIVEKVMQL